MAMSGRANDTKDTMESTPFGVAHDDFRISLFPSYSDEDYHHEMLTRRITLVLLVIYSIILALGIVGNGLVIFILGFYLKKTINTIWLLNLAIANFIFNCSLPLRIAHNALKLHWPFGKATCKFNNSVAFLNLYASAYFLAVISIEYCASVRNPARVQNLRRNRLAWFLAWGIWALALLFSSPGMHFGGTRHSPVDRDVIICFLSYGNNFIQENLNRRIILICKSVFAFVIPISVTIACGVKIYRGRGHGTRGVKFFKVISVVTVIFYLCWLPYHVFSFFDTRYLEGSRVLTVGIPVTTGLAFLSSCINPVLYIVMGYDFKERPRPSLLSAFENIFGEESSSSVPKVQVKPATEMDAQDV